VNVLTVVGLITFYQWVRYENRLVEKDCISSTVTPADYTLSVENLRPETTNEEIRELIEKHSTADNPIKIEKITRSYKILEYLKQFKKKGKLQNKIKKTKNKKKKVKLLKEMKEFKKELKEMKDGLPKTDTAYVALVNPLMAHQIAAKFRLTPFQRLYRSIKRKLCGCFSKNTELAKVDRAPEPTDIIWTNLSYERKMKSSIQRKTAYYTFFLIILGFAILLGLNYWQIIEQREAEQGTSNTVVILSVVIAILIAAINAILIIIIKLLAAYEKQDTYTNFFEAIAKKVAIAQFINTAFANILAKFILLELDSEKSSDEPNFVAKGLNLYGPSGLLQNMLVVFIT